MIAKPVEIQESKNAIKKESNRSMETKIRQKSELPFVVFILRNAVDVPVSVKV